MLENLSLALQVTLVGMGLVFGSIALLWLGMSLLVRLTVRRAAAEDEAVPQADGGERELKRRAAIAAVTVALAHEAGPQPRLFPLPPPAFVSAWQAVMRSHQLRQRGPVR